jgi:hypothetical protein
MKKTIALLSLIVVTSSFAGPYNASSASSAPPADLVFAGAKPSRSIFGGYPALTRSIRSGQASIDLNNVRSYGSPRPERFQGQIYWSVPVTYTAPTHGHGHSIVEARALVKDGQVIYWLYASQRPTRSSIPIR